VNKGGVIITIAEMCFKNKLGANLDFTNCFDDKLRDDEFFFSESNGRFIIETDPKDYNEIMNLANNYKVDLKKIGVLIPQPEIRVRGLKNKDFKLTIPKLKEYFDSTIPNLMEI
jgi:phosphoribosylformylglycinamidine synthase